MIYVFKRKIVLLIFVCLQGNSNKEKITLFSDKVERDIVIYDHDNFYTDYEKSKSEIFRSFYGNNPKKAWREKIKNLKKRKKKGGVKGPKLQQ